MKNKKTGFPLASRLAIAAIIISAFLAGTALAEPDPDIFDGTRFPAEPKPNFSLGKILKNIKLGLPGIPKSGSGGGSGSQQESMGDSQSGGLPGIGGGASGGTQGQEGLPPMPGMSGQGEPMGEEMEGDPMQKGGMGSDVEFGSESDKIGAGKESGEYPEALGGEQNGEGKPSDIEIGDRSEMIRGGEAAEVQEALGSEEGDQGRTLNKTRMPSGDQSGGRSTGVERGETMPSDM